MTQKKPIMLLASAAALTLALCQSGLASPAAGNPEPSAPGEKAEQQAPPAVEAATPTAARGTAGEPAPVSPLTTAEPQEPSVPDTSPVAPPPAEEPQEPPPPDTSRLLSAPAQESQAPTAAAPQPPSPPPSIAAARERMEQKKAEMMAERKRRYEDLRARAAEVGLELPETPPWEQAGIEPPAMPTPPEPPTRDMPPSVPGGMSAEERDAMREQRYQAMRERASQRGVELPETPPWKLMSDEERQAHREAMRSMTPEQRRAMRETHWEEMRERAQEQGISMPETPPWKQAAQRRQEMQAKREAYRKIIDEMTAEQREAAEAIFGKRSRPVGPSPMGRPMAPMMPRQGPYGGDYRMPGSMPSAPMMPGYGGRGAGPSGYEGMPAAPWYGGEKSMRQGPPPPEAGYNQPW
ncbi:MAG: hypothetical protein U9Q81_27135 [Pseudomonadota bacterium]|nr:hypothetical protein [Pseudomonadota bacterium]